jgi:hypothetical protein
LHRARVQHLNQKLGGREWRLSEYREMRRQIVDEIQRTDGAESLAGAAVVGFTDLSRAQGSYRVTGYSMHPVGFENARSELKRAASHILSHENAPDVAYHHDLAVVYLEEPVSSVQPMPLLPPSLDYMVSNGTRLRALGFGDFDPQGSKFDGKLRELDVVVSMSDCDASCDGSAEITVRGAGGQSPCRGDSGGPAILGTSYGLYVAGIASRFTSTGLTEDAPCDGRAALVYGLTANADDWYQRVRFGPPPPEDAQGCGCTAEQTPASQLLVWVFPVLWFALRRRFRAPNGLIRS